MSEIYKDTLFLIDGDRTTLDTDRLQRNLIRVVRGFGFDSGLLEDKLANAKEKNEVYSPLDTIMSAQAFRKWDQNTSGKVGDEQVGAEILQRVMNAFVPIQVMRGRNLMPDAKEFLDELAKTGVDAGIFTRGNKNWQHLKLVAAGIDQLPTKYTIESHKYEYINDCFVDGKFVIDGFEEFDGKEYDTIVALDDKEDNLIGLIDEAIGVQVLPDDFTSNNPLNVERSIGQPGNLIRVLGMRGVRAYIKMAEDMGGFREAIRVLDKITTS